MASNTRIDGTPRLSADNPGSQGGVKNGYAVRRADGWSNSDTPSLGWFPASVALSKTGVNFGPGSKIWNSTNAAKTLGQAGGGKPPKR